MIRHIFKIIWNERKNNFWIVIEFTLVFTVLWFCCDFLFFMGGRYFEDPGHNIEHTYMIVMGEKPKDVYEAAGGEKEVDRYACTMTFLDRMKKYPAIESVSLSQAAIPYGGRRQTNGFFINSDSLAISMQRRTVTPGYFEVFKVPILQGRVFDWPNEASENEVLVYPDRAGYLNSYPVSEVSSIRNSWPQGPNPIKPIIGVNPKYKTAYYDDYSPGFFTPLSKRDIHLGTITEIAIRVKPGADHNFMEQFKKDMEEQLNIGPYYFIETTPLSTLKKLSSQFMGLTSQINGVFSVVLFLILNIFLGILGSFWFRTQSRQSEIGLRIALGSSKRRVRSMMVSESMILLIISSLLATIICFNIGNFELLQMLGVPQASAWRDGEPAAFHQNIINFSITFVFLAIVSILAVWYPAKQASDIQPSETLRAE